MSLSDPNAFGILVPRWRIFLTPIRASVDDVEKYVLAFLALHNYLRDTNTNLTLRVDSLTPKAVMAQSTLGNGETGGKK